MSRQIYRYLLGLALALAAAALSADEINQHRLVDGMDIYYGVVPAKVVESHPKKHAESGMHGKNLLSGGTHHLVVTLYNNKTAQRINDAKIEAVVMPLGLAHQQKLLEPMQINGAMSYGNYFSMVGGGPFRIELQITRPGKGGTTKTEFEYRPPANR